MDTSNFRPFPSFEVEKPDVVTRLGFCGEGLEEAKPLGLDPSPPLSLARRGEDFEFPV